MPQFAFNNPNPAYANSAANLSQALFGQPTDIGDELKNRLMATQTQIAGNKLRGQNDFRDILEGVGGDLNQVDGGSLAASMGLSGVNPNVLSSMSLDPRFQEMAQRRISVASGRESSIGAQTADINARNAITTSRLNNKGGAGFKPPQLVPSNVDEIRESAIEGLGLDESRLQRTIQGNQSLGTSILDIINSANADGLGNAAFTQGRLQEFLDDAIGEETGGGLGNLLFRLLPGEGDNTVYEVNENALSSVLQPPAPASTAGASDLPNQVIYNQEDVLAQARQAITQGKKDPAMVMERLKELGITVDPGRL